MARSIERAKNFATIDLYEFEPGCEDVRVTLKIYDEKEELIFWGGEKITQLVEDFMIELSRLYHEKNEKEEEES